MTIARRAMVGIVEVHTRRYALEKAKPGTAAVAAILLHKWKPTALVMDKIILKIPIVGRLFRLAGCLPSEFDFRTLCRLFHQVNQAFEDVSTTATM